MNDCNIPRYMESMKAHTVGHVAPMGLLKRIATSMTMFVENYHYTKSYFSPILTLTLTLSVLS